MKKVFSLLLAFYGAITVMYAQNQVATLSHNGEISTFMVQNLIPNSRIFAADSQTLLSGLSCY